MWSRTMLKSSLLALALMLASLPLPAQVYEWRDAQGAINYGDRPPPGVPARLIKGEGPLSGQSPEASGEDVAGEGEPTATQRTLAERELEARERRAQQAEARARAEQEQQLAEERERNCGQARNQLAALESGQRIARFNERGEREFLDDAGRAAEIERTRTYLAANCQ